MGCEVRIAGHYAYIAEVCVFGIIITGDDVLNPIFEHGGIELVCCLESHLAIFVALKVATVSVDAARDGEKLDDARDFLTGSHIDGLRAFADHLATVFNLAGRAGDAPTVVAAAVGAPLENSLQNSL